MNGRKISIKWKLALAVVVVGVSVSLCEQLFFLSYDTRVFQLSLEKRMKTLAEVVGANLAPALLFRDRQAVQEVLQTLRLVPGMRAALLYDHEGRVLGEYFQEGEPLAIPLLNPTEVGSGFEKNRYWVLHPVSTESRHLGGLYILTTLSELHQHRYERIASSGKAWLLVLLFSFPSAFLVQRMFTKPIEDLLRTTEEIYSSQNYSLRAERGREDEFGVLVDAFNRMLEQIESKDRELQRTVARLEQSIKELDQFVYAASHDLRSPLRAVDNLATLIGKATKDLLPPDKREYLDLMHNRIKRLEALIDDLLEYSRIGRVRPPLEEVDLNELVRETLTLLAPPSGMHISVRLSVPVMLAPKTPLALVIRNLVNNAIKHHDKEEGHIWIEAEDLNRVVKISVTDDGPGIPEEYHEKIFQMFQTLRTRDEVEGSGMGLALVKKVVEIHGGQVDVVSSKGKGATFSFTWPKK